MIISLLGFVVFIRILRRALSDPMTRALLIVVAVMLAVGTVFYNRVEHWSALDALYFSVTASLTVGFGDYTPVTTAGKLFTIAYLFVGVGIIATAATTIVQRSKLWTDIEDGVASAANQQEDAPAEPKDAGDG